MEVENKIYDEKFFMLNICWIWFLVFCFWNNWKGEFVNVVFLSVYFRIVLFISFIDYLLNKNLYLLKSLKVL